MKQEKILAVVGPTASGKSALAEALAERLSGEVVSCDSMQVYRGMDIGTAKPDKQTRERVRYHLIDVVDAAEDFSAVEYVAQAERAVADILSRGKLPVLCGGTGLYLDAFLRGMPETPGGSAKIRGELTDLAEREGNERLYEELKRVDPESAAATVRLIERLRESALLGAEKITL